MFVRMPPSFNTARDEQEQYGDAWPPWPSPGFCDTSSSEWGPFPSAIDHLEDFALFPHGHALTAADGASPSNNTADGQQLTQGVVCGDQFLNALESTANSPLLLPSQALANLDYNIGHVATLLATGLSDQQFLDQPLQYIPDTAIADQIHLDQVTKLQPWVLDTDHTRVTSQTFSLASFTPDTLQTEASKTECATGSSVSQSEGNTSPGAISSRTISTATLSATSSSPEVINTQLDSLNKPETTLRVIQYGQTKTTKGAMSSRRLIPTQQPVKSSSGVVKQKRQRAVGARVNVMRSEVVRCRTLWL